MHDIGTHENNKSRLKNSLKWSERPISLKKAETQTTNLQSPGARFDKEVKPTLEFKLEN